MNPKAILAAHLENVFTTISASTHAPEIQEATIRVLTGAVAAYEARSAAGRQTSADHSHDLRQGIRKVLERYTNFPLPSVSWSLQRRAIKLRNGIRIALQRGELGITKCPSLRLIKQEIRLWDATEPKRTEVDAMVKPGT